VHFLASITAIEMKFKERKILEATNVTRAHRRRGIPENAVSKNIGQKGLDKLISLRIFSSATILWGGRGSTVVKVLCYKSEGRWFDSRWCHWNFSFT
jgi:hypothetical protein